jgi:large subunit ribosomal protein L23
MSLIHLRKPVISEKSLGLTRLNTYTFEVDVAANKYQISEAVREIFKVEPISIRTITTKAKIKRSGRRRLKIKTSPVKKAMVTLKKGQSIPLFETTGS